MDKATEIASDYTVADYCQVRERLDPETPDSRDWVEVIAAFKRRIQERFLQPINLRVGMSSGALALSVNGTLPIP